MSFSFAITSSADLFKAFSLAVDEYLADPQCSAKAVVSAILGWHVVEWIFTEFPAKVGFGNLAAFQSDLKRQCPSLAYLQDITNGTKHQAIKRYIPVVRRSHAHEGGIRRGL